MTEEADPLRCGPTPWPALRPANPARRSHDKRTPHTRNLHGHHARPPIRSWVLPRPSSAPGPHGARATPAACPSAESPTVSFPVVLGGLPPGSDEGGAGRVSICVTTATPTDGCGRSRLRCRVVAPARVVHGPRPGDGRGDASAALFVCHLTNHHAVEALSAVESALPRKMSRVSGARQMRVWSCRQSSQPVITRLEPIVGARSDLGGVLTPRQRSFSAAAPDGLACRQAPRGARYPRQHRVPSRQRRVLRLGRSGHVSGCSCGDGPGLPGHPCAARAVRRSGRCIPGPGRGRRRAERHLPQHLQRRSGATRNRHRGGRG